MTTELVTPEFIEHVQQLKTDLYQKYREIGQEQTPEVDGSGRKIIEKRPDNFDYIIEPWMRDRLDYHFPGWSWDMAAPLHFLGSEWVVGQGHLTIIEESLLNYGIIPPVRRFYGVDAVRIQYKQGLPHTQGNIVDIGNNCQQALSGALKRAINRLTRIGDDVYGKRIESEGAGTLEEVILQSNDTMSFNRWLEKHKIRWSEVYEIMGTRTITDYASAYTKIKVAKDLK